MTLEQMIQLAETQARAVLVGTREELMPQWLLVKADGNVEIIGTPWSNDYEKHLTVAVMRKTMRDKQAVAYSLVVEAWFAQVQGEEAKKPYQGPPPRERADRKECVVITAVDHYGGQRYRHLEIIRDKRGRCRELRSLIGPEHQIISSLFDNLLEPKGRPN